MMEMRVVVHVSLLLVGMVVSQKIYDSVKDQKSLKKCEESVEQSATSLDHAGNPKLESCIPAIFKYVY